MSLLLLRVCLRLFVCVLFSFVFLLSMYYQVNHKSVQEFHTCSCSPPSCASCRCCCCCCCSSSMHAANSARMRSTEMCSGCGCRHESKKNGREEQLAHSLLLACWQREHVGITTAGATSAALPLASTAFTSCCKEPVVSCSCTVNKALSSWKSCCLRASVVLHSECQGGHLQRTMTSE